MCRLLETLLCLDGQLQNIACHQQRVEAAFRKLFPGLPVVNLAESIIVPQEYATGSYRVRIVYDQQIISVEYFATVPRSFKSFTLVNHDSIDYSCKYEDRSVLNSIAEQKNGTDEAIIIKEGNVTDTTISNLLFSDGEHWFTPDTPLLKGTMRQSLLDNNICIEKRISVNDIEKYQTVLMVNAILGFQPENAVPISAITNLHSFCDS